MLVEFIGAAGAGKSFLTDRVIDRLLSNGWSARNFDFIEIDKASPRNLFLVLRAIYLCALTRPKALPLVRYSTEAIASYNIRREICDRADDISITSEGLFHHIITFQRNSKSLNMNQISSLLFRKIRPPELVVMVEVSAETVFTRRTRRNRENDHFSRESVMADVEVLRHSIDAMVHVQETLYPQMRVFRVNSEREGGDEAVASIVSAIESYVRDADAASLSPSKN